MPMIKGWQEYTQINNKLGPEGCTTFTLWHEANVPIGGPKVLDEIGKNLYFPPTEILQK
jgi:hypothetical protein